MFLVNNGKFSLQNPGALQTNYSFQIQFRADFRYFVRKFRRLAEIFQKIDKGVQKNGNVSEKQWNISKIFITMIFPENTGDVENKMIRVK